MYVCLSFDFEGIGKFSVSVIIGQFVCLAVTSFIGLKARETRGGNPLVSRTFRATGVGRKLDR